MIGSGSNYKLIHSMSSRWKIHRLNSATFALILIGLSIIQLSLVCDIHVVQAAELDSGALDGELDDIVDVDKDDDLDDLPPPPAPPPDATNSTGTRSDLKSVLSLLPGIIPPEMPSRSDSKSVLSLLPGIIPPEMPSRSSGVIPFNVLSETPPQKSIPNEPIYPTVELDQISVFRSKQPLVFNQVLSKKIELFHQKLLDQIVD